MTDVGANKSGQLNDAAIMSLITAIQSNQFFHMLLKPTRSMYSGTNTVVHTFSKPPIGNYLVKILKF